MIGELCTSLTRSGRFANAVHFSCDPSQEVICYSLVVRACPSSHPMPTAITMCRVVFNRFFTVMQKIDFTRPCNLLLFGESGVRSCRAGYESSAIVPYVRIDIRARVDGALSSRAKNKVAELCVPRLAMNRFFAYQTLSCRCVNITERKRAGGVCGGQVCVRTMPQSEMLLDFRLVEFTLSSLPKTVHMCMLATFVCRYCDPAYPVLFRLRGFPVPGGGAWFLLPSR